MSLYACTTYSDHVIRALALKATPLWFGLGRTTTPWPVENNPPSPQPGATDIEEPLVFMQPSLVTLARPITEAAYNLLEANQKVTVNGLYYQFVADGDAFTQQARWVYVKGIHSPVSGMPLGTFRTVGIFSGLVPQAGYESASWLLPAHVQNHGMLRWLDHNPPIILTSTFLGASNVIVECR